MIAPLLLSVAAATGMAQEESSSPVQRLLFGRNEVTIYEKFTVILEHSSRIKSVLDFDAEVIKIDPVHGHPNQITVYALATGVTTITIIDEAGQNVSVEVLVRGDVRHLENYIRRYYPHDDVQIEEIKGSVRLSGWVTKPQHINEIVTIAEQFYPNVMNHMQTGGVQQVMLKATIMEVNRSKLRRLGMNFGLLGQDYFLNSTPGPITPVTGINTTGTSPLVTFSGFNNTSVSFGFLNSNASLRGFIDALRNENLLKIHATPMVVTHNGEPANLLNGGEAPVVVPAGLGTTAIEFKPFGVIMNGVPVILGNGRLKLQIDASVVERDFANSVTVSGVTVPSFTVRKVNTQVEMNFGETLVIGGLIQKREDSSTSKVPFFGELPWIGAAFSKKQYNESETELLILVTPEHVAPMTPDQVPAGGPGMFTDTVTDHELYWNGMLEVPRVGPECSAQFNCLECEQNGYCQRHPHGCSGRGMLNGMFSGAGGGRGTGRGAGGCGASGCTDPSCSGCGTDQPMLIQPQEMQRPVPMDHGLLPPQSAESSGSGRTPVSYTRPVVETPSETPEKKTRSGLLSPLFR
ncbi:MAG: hypothetical protein R3C49_04605 [Planctomycetaceae bacterium]